MIYAKIYLKVEGNETYIITESAIKNVDEKYCMLTGKHITKYGDPYEISKTRILSAHNVAISIEAKDMFLKLLAFDNENKKPGIFNDDFVFEEYRNTKKEIDGEFAFLPDKGSINKKVFNVKKTIIINFLRLSRSVLDLMQIYSNDVLEKLDITEPIDEYQNELLLNDK